MIWIIILGLLLLLAGYLLWMPIVIRIDTAANQYYAQFRGLAKASLEGDLAEMIRIRLRVLFVNLTFYPLKMKVSGTKKKHRKPDYKTSKNRMDTKSFIRLLKSFEVQRFRLDLDTGSSIANAKLYPVAALVNYKVGGVHINFEGRNRLVLLLKNRPIRIIKSFINF